MIKACAFPFQVLVYGELTTLFVDRTYGIGTSTPTLILKWFGGGKILYELFPTVVIYFHKLSLLNDFMNKYFFN